jgi:hypothetical protein
MVCGMNKLRVKCMKCGKEWEKESSLSWGPEDVTSSLCNVCLKEVISPTIHKKQLREGNFDCFGKSADYCDQQECKYRQWCVDWEEAETEPQKRTRRR